MKKSLLRIMLGILSVLIVVIAGSLLYVSFGLPNVDDAPDIVIESSPERLSRGAYLVNHVAICMDCHSERDWSLFSGPLKPGTQGMGGELFDENLGLPGRYYASNITPAGIGDWTDGEVFRAITSGVNRDGNALFPLMPYPNYGQMDDEDIYSVIAYLRTLEPIEHEVPKSVSNFPMNLIIKTLPAKPAFQKMPEKGNTLEYGKYLVNAAGCKSCHTPFAKGEYNEDLLFAGSREFPMPQGGLLKSANITFHEKTGIGTWTKERFVERFKSMDSSLVSIANQPDSFNTIMPWSLYSGMEEDDLEAIYEYLKSVKPVENQVVLFQASN
ncbi:MAG: c-type cytochrome [Balneolales bacterium]